MVLKGSLRENIGCYIDMELDFHSSKMSVLPIEARTAMKFMLPYTIDYQKTNIFYGNQNYDNYLTEFDKDKSTCIKLFETKLLSK